MRDHVPEIGDHHAETGDHHPEISDHDPETPRDHHAETGDHDPETGDHDGPLPAADAQRVLDTIAERSASLEQTAALHLVWTVWEHAGVPTMVENNRTTLQLYLKACSQKPEVAGTALKSAARVFVCFARHMIEALPRERQALLKALTQGSVASLYALVGAANAELLMPLRCCPLGWLNEVAKALLRRSPPDAIDSSKDTAGRRYTALGGVFLLLPLLDEIPLAPATAEWPQPEGCTATDLVRFLVLMKCCGAQRASAVFHDPLIRDLMNIHAAVDAASVRHWQASLSRGNLRALLREIADWSLREAAVDGRRLVLCNVQQRNDSIGLLIDGVGGSWLLAARYSASRPERLVKELRGWLSDEAIVSNDDSFAEALQSPFVSLQIEPLRISRATASTSQERPELTKILERPDEIAADLAFLTLPKGLHGPRFTDLSFSVVAQVLLRSFGRRLPGFAHSSLPYLYRNFLDLPANFEDQPAQRVVRLGQPPLHVVLRITGMDRNRYRLSWLDDRPFALFPEA